MKTETLIELQRSITQGEWRIYNAKGGKIYNNWSVCDANASRIAKIEELPGQSGEEEYRNATAIALVPELIAEVIRLREALSDINDIATKADTIGSVSMHPELRRVFIELSVSTNAENARAALANDK